jgi:hypothetical protein
MERYNESIDHIDRALDINPNDTPALVGKGVVLGKL